MRSIKTYITILYKMGFCYSIYEIYRRLFWIGKNKQEIFAYEARCCEQKLYKRYKSLIEAPLEPTPQESHLSHQDIWIFWGQGMDNAPVVVKKCYASVQKYCKGYRVHLLDNENISEYVSLPEDILRLYDGGKGILRPAHFSDILRTELLIQYGGIWIDATILLTSRLPEYITNQSMFMYRETNINIPEYIFANYLIASERSNPFLKRVLELVYAFWREHTTIPISMRDYMFYYNFVTLLSQHNEQAYNIVQKIPFIPNDLNVLILFKFFNFPYNEQLLQYLFSASPVHKLTYKYTQDSGTPETIYDHIVNLKVEGL